MRCSFCYETIKGEPCMICVEIDGEVHARRSCRFCAQVWRKSFVRFQPQFVGMRRRALVRRAQEKRGWGDASVSP